MCINQPWLFQPRSLLLTRNGRRRNPVSKKKKKKDLDKYSSVRQ